MKRLIDSYLRYLLFLIYKSNTYFRRLILLALDNLITIVSISFSFFLSANTYDSDFLWLYYLIPFFATPIYLISGQYSGLTKYFGSLSFYPMWLRNIVLINITFLFGLTFGIKTPNYKFFLLLLININLFMTIFKSILGNFLLNYIDRRNFLKEKIVIYGAGAYGSQLAAFLKTSKRFKVSFFVDDSSNLWGRNIDGIPIQPPKYLEKNKAEIKYVLISFTHKNKESLRKFLQDMKEMGLSVRQILSKDIFTSKKNFSDYLEPFKVENILGREIIDPDPKLLGPSIKDKVICITGAGGSIGSELCRQLISLNPRKLILLDINEPSLYKISNEFHELNSEIPYISILGDVADKQLLKKIFVENSVNIVFHCAAYKHVPLLESNPIEGLKNNIFSTKNLCLVSNETKLDQVILISSDKAVRPTNIMGASKRVAEIIFQYFAKQIYELNKEGNYEKHTKFSMVRFGNVIGSSGSVIPLFEKQLAKGGPLTVTHKDIIRYFMTIPEAAQLVIQSSAMSEGGEIFLLDMGDPVNIYELARKIIELKGLAVKDENNINGDIEIEIVGLRPGEKLFEELIIDSQALRTNHPLIFKAKNDGLLPKNFIEKLGLLEKSLLKQDLKNSLLYLSKIVPEWQQKIN